MTRPLVTYLHDHLAGASFALELLEQLGTQPGPAAQLVGLDAEIEEDRDVVLQLVERLGAGSSVVKEAAGWLAEKASRLKLRHQAKDPLGTFEALETLALGVLGKQALWRALAVAAENEPALRDVDFVRLIERADSQHARVERARLDAARRAFTIN